MTATRMLLLGLLPLLPCAALAQSACTSDGVPQPVAVLERFINADCDRCWRDKATPEPAKGVLALDWIVPGSRGEDAPLSTGATNDALLRLKALSRAVPTQADARRTALNPRGPRVRVAHGETINDYIGTSVTLSPGAGGPWNTWLLLVEELPVGAEGSPVARRLVRNVFQPPWDTTRSLTRAEQRRLHETRAMQVPEGARPSRLSLVAVVHDARGRIRAIAHTVCKPEGRQG